MVFLIRTVPYKVISKARKQFNVTSFSVSRSLTVICSPNKQAFLMNLQWLDSAVMGLFSSLVFLNVELFKQSKMSSIFEVNLAFPAAVAGNQPPLTAIIKPAETV
jgi:hypothetical protein